MEKLTKLKCFLFSNKIFNKKDIFETVKPLIFISKLVGLGPFTYTRVGEIETSFLGTIHCYLMCLLLFVFFIITFSWNIDFAFSNFNLVIGIVHITDVCLSSCTMFITYLLCATVNRSKVIKFFTLVDKVDKHLIKSTYIYSKTYIYLLLSIFCYLLLCFLEFTLCIFTLEFDVKSNDFYFEIRFLSICLHV